MIKFQPPDPKPPYETRLRDMKDKGPKPTKRPGAKPKPRRQGKGKR